MGFKGLKYDRSPPNATNAERAVIGACLQDGGKMPDAVRILKAGASEFFLPRNQKIWDAMLAEYREIGDSFDGLNLEQRLRQDGSWEEVGYEGLARCVNSAASSERAEDYARIVHETHLARMAYFALVNGANRLLDGKAPIIEMLAQIEADVSAVTQQRITSKAQEWDSLLEDVIAGMEDGGAMGARTGFHQLDEMTSGFHPGDLVIVAGRPSMGKTAFGLNVAQRMAMNDGLRVLFFSLEMSAAAIAQRVLSGQADVPMWKLRRGELTEHHRMSIDTAQQRLARLPFWVEDSRTNLDELVAIARSRANRGQLDAIFVDYLQLVRPSKPDKWRERREREVAEVAAGLKELARITSVPVIAMAQLNRAPTGRSDNRPVLSDLRESGAIEQDADTVLLLHREEYYHRHDQHWLSRNPEKVGAADVIVAKQRNGPIGTVTLGWWAEFMRFESARPGERVALDDGADSGSGQQTFV